MRLLLACVLLCGCRDAVSSAATTDGSVPNHPGTADKAPAAASEPGSPTMDGGPLGSMPRPGGSSTANTGGSTGPLPVQRPTVHLVPNVVAGVQEPKNTSSNIGSKSSSIRIGSGTHLMSLKYYIMSIQLCEHVDVMGSGYSSANGCIMLYQDHSSSPPDYANYLVTAAQHDTTADRFVDLMSAAGQAALRHPVTVELPGANPTAAADYDAGPVTPSQVAVFRYGLINFYRPIKVTAEFPIVGHPDQYFRTKTITHITTERTVDGMNDTERVQIGDTLSGATEETTYMLNNGGALFTFQKPFVITQADVDAATEIKVDLVFNPNNFGQAYEANNCADQPDSPICDPHNNVTIDMPYVRMNPVPRKAGEKTRKETYLMDYAPSSKLRIELYYNDADPEASVQGVDAAVVYDPSATMPSNNVIASNFVSQTGSVTSSNASVTLMDYRRAPNLTGLVRRRSGTATVHCVFTGALCPSVGMTASQAYTYVGDTVVSTD
jgi:hypothetical protein